ncbi:MAG: glycosyltransferase family 4 protein [Candidatus Staskawiczbacteria bacterium]|nr:glycosyltransferase family 4 protein [Candidatus Staskawiczbacteria bacterium]
MRKGNILVVSRTPWYEAPRIRHHLSRLLRDSGYEIYYLETVFGKKPISEVVEKGININRIKERIHHQLRLFNLIDILNDTSVKNQIKKIKYEIKFVAVINFNYDYHFIRGMFDAPFISVINDDFVASAIPLMKSKIRYKLTLTCKKSDSVLSVSYYLDRSLKILSDKAQLLLPWSLKSYTRPEINRRRNVVLYFGFISRIDTKILDKLCEKNFRIRFVGPISGNGLRVKKQYQSYDNIEFLSSRPLSEVNLEDVCCSIALYDLTLKENIAITASNRMFQLLSEGIPLVYPNMPYLIEAPSTVITRCSSLDEYPIAINYFKTNFDVIQDDIRLFLQEHTLEKRSIFINNLINQLNNLS